jgi:hypothetical protein
MFRLDLAIIIVVIINRPSAGLYTEKINETFDKTSVNNL